MNFTLPAWALRLAIFPRRDPRHRERLKRYLRALPKSVLQETREALLKYKADNNLDDHHIIFEDNQYVLKPTEAIHSETT